MHAFYADDLLAIVLNYATSVWGAVCNKITFPPVFTKPQNGLLNDTLLYYTICLFTILFAKQETSLL